MAGKPKGPLSGVRVVDVTRHLPGPYAAALLADLGADVVKVELPFWPDPARAHPPNGALFKLLNRRKRLVSLDFRKDAGRKRFLELVRSSRVFVEGFRPGLLERLGLGAADLLKVRKDLVFCSLTGYGRTGRLARAAGHDLAYLGWAGALSQNPGLPPLPAADAAGGLYAALAITAALRKKGPSVLDVPLADAALAASHLPASEFVESGASPAAGERWWNGSDPFYAVYPAKDGGWMAVAALEKPFQLRLLELLHLEALEGRPAGEVRAALSAKFRERTRDEWTEALLEKECCVAPVRTIGEAVQDAKGRKAFPFPVKGL